MKKFAAALFLVVAAACSRERAEPAVTTASAPPAQEPSQAPPPAARPPAVAGPKLPFADEGPRDPSFAAYRERLLAAVRARDEKAVAALSDPNIRTSFGNGGGSPNLEELELLLPLGGTFREGMFWAPYVYSTFPDEHDAFETLAVIADDVPLRATPDASAVAIATLSRDLVTRASEPGVETPWLKVTTADGKTGFVEAKFLRSPVDYRAGFVKGADGWRMNALVAGDGVQPGSCT